MNYIDSLNDAITYIEENLLEDITINDIANHIYISPFHFQRIFSLMTGVTIGDYIKRRRLSLAAYDLKKNNSSVIDIASKYGYDTPESFSKAFKRFHGITPKEVKRLNVKIKSYSPLHIKVMLKGAKEMNYQIKKMSEMEIVVLVKEFEHESSTTDIPLFWDEYYQKGYQNKVCSVLGVCLPASDEKKGFIYGIGCFKEMCDVIPPEFEIKKIPEATWAIFECIGSIPKAIQNKWKEIYEEWLPSSKYEMVNGYDFEVYTEGDSQKDDYKTEIWIMVVPK